MTKRYSEDRTRLYLVSEVGVGDRVDVGGEVGELTKYRDVYLVVANKLTYLSPSYFRAKVVELVPIKEV